MFAVLVQLALFPLLEVQLPALALPVELENDGTVQLALTVSLARIRVLLLISSQHAHLARLVARIRHYLDKPRVLLVQIAVHLLEVVLRQ